ncbi:unnamed protein product [Paramecium octaurelia]|uniref:Uncharacterized protein n=1 Tax=Paramecium octaurelia TaxID=43137 RepID=A0A8S1YL33_PAROT|nr:unnamed protein product [Paramecium octaurelia]
MKYLLVKIQLMKEKLYKDFVQILDARIQDLSSVYNEDVILIIILIAKKIQKFYHQIQLRYT